MRVILTTLLLFTTSLFGPALPAEAASQPHWSTTTIDGPDGAMAVESVTDASDKGSRPLVLLLSGTKGFFKPAYRTMAERFAAAGMDAYLVPYLSARDLHEIARAGSAPARIRYYATRQARWIETVRKIATALNADPHHNGKIGVFGLSLGAQVASAVSANNQQFSAVVLVDGGFPEGYRTPVTSMPPLQLIWGEADRAFPISGAKRLETQMKQLGGPVTLTTYPGMSHGFILAQDRPEAIKAWSVAAHFFQTSLSR
ncbi:dienelactone hydrolase family protein [Rhizobium sp.]|uniref:dienelactone hydrolase family protein n=1 Tax=Rhizobium sp. TaxID=391 RepID=UPI002AA78EEC